MRVLLPLKNKQCDTDTADEKNQQLAENSEDEEESISETEYSCVEEDVEGEQEFGQFQSEKESCAAEPTANARGEEESTEPKAKKEPSLLKTVPSRKREHPATEKQTPSSAEDVAVENNHSKRSRVCISDDSKPPAKPMVAPKRLPSPSEDRHNLGQHRSESNAWEENEPTRGNHYYKNHPSNNPHLASTSAGNPGISFAPAAVATSSGEYVDPAHNTHEEVEFAAALKQEGLEIVEQEGDGNCLFRAISLQVYGDANMHAQVRELCLNFMAVNKEHFGQFMTAEEPFERYIARKREIGVHGNNPEIQAISEMFNRPIQVFTPATGAKPLNIFHKEYTTTDTPIRLSYHDNNHYNAVIDPANPTAGLGLGLPGLQPGLADKMQLAAATAESDLQNDMEQAVAASQKDHVKYSEDQLQRVLKESSYSVDSMYKNKAIALSDVDATNFELEQTILETSLQSFFSSPHEERKQRATPTGRRRRQNAAPPQDEGPRALPPSNEARTPVAAAAAPSAPSPEHPSSCASSSPSSGRAAAASAGRESVESISASPVSPYDHPAVVQELVMNGFELKRVVQAYELCGDNFDDILAFLVSNGS